MKKMKNYSDKDAFYDGIGRLPNKMKKQFLTDKERSRLDRAMVQVLQDYTKTLILLGEKNKTVVCPDCGSTIKVVD